MKPKISRWIFVIAALSVAVIVVGLFSLCVGPAGIPFGRVVSIIFSAADSPERSIIMDIRLPRIILGFAIGGMLALAGVMLQGMFRNPLVEPYTLGISGGAALGVCLNVVLRVHKAVGYFTMPVFGFFGAAASMALIYAVCMRRGILRMHGLLLTGVMVSFISSSVILLVMAVSRAQEMQAIIFWIMGSLGDTGWMSVGAVLAVSLASLAASYIFCLDLNAISLGEEEARHLGVDVERVKRLLFLLTSVIAGFCVSIAGMIGFVGLVVPHVARMLVGSDHRALLVTSFLSGAIFLVACDTLARTVVAPMDLPVGVITGIVGGVIFIYALAKKPPLPGGV